MTTINYKLNRHYNAKKLCFSSSHRKPILKRTEKYLKHKFIYIYIYLLKCCLDQNISVGITQRSPVCGIIGTMTAARTYYVKIGISLNRTCHPGNCLWMIELVPHSFPQLPSLSLQLISWLINIQAVISRSIAKIDWSFHSWLRCRTCNTRYFGQDAGKVWNRHSLPWHIFKYRHHR